LTEPFRLEMKKTHMLRCRSIASLQRTLSTSPRVDFSRASHLDLFEQPAGGFFQHLLETAVLPSVWIGKFKPGRRVEGDSALTGSQPHRNRARMDSLQILNTTGRDPEIHLCRALHEVHRNDPVTRCAMRLSIAKKRSVCCRELIIVKSKDSTELPVEVEIRYLPILSTEK
jgi:hypothetical protein